MCCPVIACLQLRGGAVAAFALVKAVGAADVIQYSADSGEGWTGTRKQLGYTQSSTGHG